MVVPINKYEVELRKEIRELIKPWTTRRNKPPFTVEQLVVMALACITSTKRRVKQTEVFVWITQNFKYYTNLALSNTSWGRTGGFTMAPNATAAECRDFQEECDMVFRQYDVPISCLPSTKPLGEKNTWKVTSGAARLFLQDLLPSKNEVKQEPFPFMRLPAELRNRVYELVLQFPKSGLCVKVKKQDWKKRAMVRIPAQFFVMRNELCSFENHPWPELNSAYYDLQDDLFPDRRSDQVLSCQPPVETLTLLLANKQIYREAMPVFFGTNSFIFAELRQLHDFLQATAPARRNHIEHVGFHYRGGDRKCASAAFKMLKEIPHLRKLDISIDESWFKDLKASKSQEPQYPDILKLPGVFTLRSMRGLETVRFHGDCETFKTLVPEMTKAKKEVKAPQRKRKAKAEGGSKAQKGETQAGDDGDGDKDEVETVKKAKKAKKVKSG